jgi:hypothetical protein
MLILICLLFPHIILILEGKKIITNKRLAVDDVLKPDGGITRSCPF